MSATVHALPPEDMRVPPHDLGAEEALLGAMLLARQALEDGLEVCTPDDFHAPGNGRIFEAMERLHHQGSAVDQITVAAELRRTATQDQAGEERHLVGLVAAAGSTTRAAHYARIVADHAALRALIGAGSEITEVGYSRPADVPAAIDSAEQMVTAVGDRANPGEVLPIGATVNDWYDRLAEAHEAGEFPGVATGLHDLDNTLAGLRGGQLVTIGARPGAGKTAIACQLTLNVAKAGVPVLFVSAEMSRDELTQRFISILSGVDLDRIRDPRKLVERDWSPLLSATATLESLPVHIDENPGATVLGIRAKARRLKRQGLGLVVVDYIQLLTGSGRPENRQVEVAEISRGLKRASLELDLPIVSLAQLNRQVEARQDKRPGLADLRESGAIENDSDVVAFLYREEMHRPDTPNPGLLEVIIAKHRNGPTGTVKLAYQTRNGRIVSMTRGH